MTPFLLLQALILLGLLVTGVLIIAFKDLLAASIAFAAFSLLLSLEFYILQAPDVAIAEAGIGAGLTTAIFIIAILGVTGAKGHGAFAGVAIGITLAVIHIVGIQVTGVSVNPARSIGPALFSGGTAIAQLWLFILAPLVGAVIAWGINRALESGRQLVTTD